MRRYVWFGCGAVVLGGAAWYFGRPTPPPPRPEPAVAMAELPNPEAPKPLPPRVVEVIDLARAYEPVQDTEQVHPGGVDPASFIQVPEAVDRIPPAVDVDGPYADVIRTVREAPSGWSLWSEPDRERIDLVPREVRPPTRLGGDLDIWGLEAGPLQDLLFFEEGLRPVQLDVMPREVPAIATGLLNFVATPQVPGGPVFTPMGVPYSLEPQPVPPNVSIQNGLLNFTPSAPVEQLRVMPREVRVKVKQGEQERRTGVRDDDLIGVIGP